MKVYSYLAIAMASLVFLTFILAGFSLKLTKLERGLCAGWVTAVSILSFFGVFEDFSGRPPAVVIFPAVILVLLGWLIFSNRGQQIADQSTLWVLAGVQSFRIILELLLHALYGERLIPKLMTYEGNNLDIVYGASALLVAWLSFRAEKRIQKLVRIWNVIGIVFVCIATGIGIFSVPTFFQLFTEEPANRAVGMFPFTLIPAWLVPLALSLHVLSLRKKLTV